MTENCNCSALDRAIIVATQAGLPLAPHPWDAVAKQVGATPEQVMNRVNHMLRSGVIRRIGAVPNHYALGYRANGMSVWDIEDSQVDALGRRIAQSGLVSHCYLRSRDLPHWPYNLFAMVHGRDRMEVENKLREIQSIVGDAARAHEVLYSSRILKKTGLRLVAQ